jgi:DNA-dependent protein kinase catalytic subunit
MNVFVNEPLLDWEKYARRLAREQSAVEHLAATFPKKKIDIAKRKLEGENPASITLAELSESTIMHRVRHWFYLQWELIRWLWRSRATRRSGR